MNNDSGIASDIISRYAKTFTTLLQYDEQSLPMPTGVPSRFALDYQRELAHIELLKQVLIEMGDATPLFGQQRGEAFEELIGNIGQIMCREEKAANLLYHIISDQPFLEGNKQIGSLMFLRYLKQEGMGVQINPDAMTALACLVDGSIRS